VPLDRGLVYDEVIFYLLIPAVSLATASEDESDTGPYALPRNKANLEPCNQAALTSHPGVIEVQREPHADGKFGCFIK
jgi:hypothetical protein